MRAVQAALVLGVLVLAAVVGAARALSSLQRVSTVRVTETEMRIATSARQVPGHYQLGMKSVLTVR